jgi:hypothetical protein
MGACGSSEQGGGSSEFQPTMEEVQRSKAIEKMLRDEERKLSKEVKVSTLSPLPHSKQSIDLTLYDSLRYYCWVIYSLSPTDFRRLAHLVCKCSGPGSSGKSTILVRFYLPLTLSRVRD